MDLMRPYQYFSPSKNWFDFKLADYVHTLTFAGTNGKSITDGPYTEGKEVVAGYFVVNAKDYDDALSLTKEYPDYDFGGKVQVRQVMKIEM